MNPIVLDMEEALATLPVIDMHTHLVGGRLGARGLHDVLLYHFVVSDLYGAGCPSGARLSQYPEWPTTEEAHFRIQEALPYLEHIRNTTPAWGVRIILRDLYDWHEPVTADNWRRLDAIIRERADDRAWHHSILDGLNIKRTGTELARRWSDADDDRLQYCVEWGMFTRCQWGEYDTALYELERTWGRQPESPAPIGGDRPPTERTIATLSDVHEAIAHYVGVIPYDRVLATATHMSTDLDYTPVSVADMEAALSRRAIAGPRERDVYASYIQELFLTELAKTGKKHVFQFSFAAEPLPFETGSRIRQETLGQLAAMIARHPRVHFQVFVASRHANQTLCTMVRELPNFSLAAIWWHNFHPEIMRGVLGERLDMVASNRWVGFFSDAYVVEWTYAKSLIARKQLARVLAERIEQGQYTRDDALSIARAILFESPQSLLGFVPRK